MICVRCKNRVIEDEEMYYCKCANVKKVDLDNKTRYLPAIWADGEENE